MLANASLTPTMPSTNTSYIRLCYIAAMNPLLKSSIASFRKALNLKEPWYFNALRATDRSTLLSKEMSAQQDFHLIFAKQNESQNASTSPLPPTAILEAREIARFYLGKREYWKYERVIDTIINLVESACDSKHSFNDFQKFNVPYSSNFNTIESAFAIFIECPASNLLPHLYPLESHYFGRSLEKRSLTILVSGCSLIQSGDSFSPDNLSNTCTQRRLRTTLTMRRLPNSCNERSIRVAL